MQAYRYFNASIAGTSYRSVWPGIFQLGTVRWHYVTHGIPFWREYDGHVALGLKNQCRARVLQWTHSHIPRAAHAVSQIIYASHSLRVARAGPVWCTFNLGVADIPDAKILRSILARAEKRRAANGITICWNVRRKEIIRDCRRRECKVKIYEMACSASCEIRGNTVPVRILVQGVGSRCTPITSNGTQVCHLQQG